MVTKWLDWLKESPVRMAGVGVVALLLVVAVVFVAMSGGGDEEDLEIDLSGVLAEPVGLSETDVEERVRQTVEAQKPTEAPEPTPDIPGTLVAIAEATRVAGEQAVVMGGLYVPPGEPDRQAAEPYRLSLTDERFMDGLGRPVWFSVRIHLELEKIFERKPEQFLNMDESRLVLEWMEIDIDRALRDLEGNDSVRSGVSPAVRGFALHVEDEIVLSVRESVSLYRTMYEQANSEEGLTYSELTVSGRGEIDRMYWSVKENLRDFEGSMEEYGCSICGEIYRARSDG